MFKKLNILEDSDKHLRMKSKEVTFPLTKEDKQTIQQIIKHLTYSQIEEYSEKYDDLQRKLSEDKDNAINDIIDYDNATLYLDEEKNEMYQGVDGQHPELLLTEDRKDAKYMMKPDGYNSLKYKIANDKYSGMKFHGDLFDYQYCPMVLNIQTYFLR